MPGRTFTREFKLEVVQQIATGEKRVAQVCREHNLAESLVNRWRKDVRERGEAAFTAAPATETEQYQQRIAELERFCGRLALENEILKKALHRSKSNGGTP